MEETLSGLKRSKYCGEFSARDLEKNVTAMGFVAKSRNLGAILFMDLRDRAGIVQISFAAEDDPALFEKAAQVKSEYVIAVTGKVVARGEKNINKDIPTGEIEIKAEELRIISAADLPPFAITENSNVSEPLRLKYRYLDLRRAVMQQKLIVRDKIMRVTHSYLAKHGFLNIETPFLGKSTPEGARDYLVPSRVHPGKFYALPQSPQLYKQILMISGLDRYYQIARCFRDEDLRANRQPEFSQIDLEMSFVSGPEDVMNIAEGLIKEIFKQVLGMSFKGKFRRFKYKEAMERFGSDKPDTRFGLEITDITKFAKTGDFAPFKQAAKRGHSVRCVNAKGLADAFTRKAIDKAGDFVKDYGLKGLAYAIVKDNEITSPIKKYFSEQDFNGILTQAGAEKGDIIFFAAGKNQTVLTALGVLRLQIAKEHNLIDESRYDFLWVTDFPLFEYDEQEKRLVAMHHPFTSPRDKDIRKLDTAPAKVLAKAYDLVINGVEAGGGSIRIHQRAVQQKMFETIGLSESDIKERFGFFMEAFRYGTPPHGGLAFGLDRLVMLLTNTDNIKDVIAFPKVQNASCLMQDAPGEVSDDQLKDLGIIIKE
ncbi:MAG: aspartate--tRNA ligase [Christensenellales bacterium]|jgi:aspartyl-tRNA synthetase